MYSREQVEKAKLALCSLIGKSRVHLYKPIQIAEILYHDRVYHDVDLLDLETYRTRSKKWRDEISLQLLGRICTSSARFQDDLFNENAIPPHILDVLGEENRRTNGAVEAFIYALFDNKHLQLALAIATLTNSTKDNFKLQDFINSFWDEPGLKRSLDKVYEVIVFSLFSVLVEALDLRVSISVSNDKLELLSEFNDFTKNVANLDFSNRIYTQDARVYRVGVTNAADRGLDMYSNWGPAIQIKHLSLDEQLAESIVNSVSSDRIVIVCKNAEKKVILSLLNQIGWKSKIQSIITEDDLISWYEKALRGEHSDILGDKLLNRLQEQIEEEFPSVDNRESTINQRGYDKIKDDFWKQ